MGCGYLSASEAGMPLVRRLPEESKGLKWDMECDW